MENQLNTMSYVIGINALIINFKIISIILGNTGSDVYRLCLGCMGFGHSEGWMIPYCVDQNIALTTYSPLASGRLAHDSTEKSKRLESDQIAKSKYDDMAQADKVIIKRLDEVAQNHGVPRAQIALAWLMQKQPITVPVIGVTKFSHLESALPAIDIQLTSEEIDYMEKPYVPHKVVGAQ